MKRTTVSRDEVTDLELARFASQQRRSTAERIGAGRSAVPDTSGLLALLEQDNQRHKETRPPQAELLGPPMVWTEPGYRERLL